MLDTQILRGTQPELLRALVGRGFRLHVSMVAFEEAWGDAVREGSKGKLCGRVRRIAQFIDATEPLKAPGVELIRRIGGQVRPPLIPAEQGESGKLLEAWRQIVSGELPEELFLGIGKTMEDAARARDSDWLATAARATALPNVEGSKELPEAKIAARVAHEFRQSLCRMISVPPGAQERFDAYIRYLASRAAAAYKGKAPKKKAENDGEDVQLLMHLGEDAFLATDDRDLIISVDASGTFQAPWVRSIGELVLIELPPGRPWGKNARREFARHTPRTKSTLKALYIRARERVGLPPE